MQENLSPTHPSPEHGGSQRLHSCLKSDTLQASQQEGRVQLFGEPKAASGSSCGLEMSLKPPSPLQ